MCLTKKIVSKKLEKNHPTLFDRYGIKGLREIKRMLTLIRGKTPVQSCTSLDCLARLFDAVCTLRMTITHSALQKGL